MLSKEKGPCKAIWSAEWQKFACLVLWFCLCSYVTRRGQKFGHDDLLQLFTTSLEKKWSVEWLPELSDKVV